MTDSKRIEADETFGGLIVSPFLLGHCFRTLRQPEDFLFLNLRLLIKVSLLQLLGLYSKKGREKDWVKSYFIRDVFL